MYDAWILLILFPLGALAGVLIFSNIFRKGMRLETARKELALARKSHDVRQRNMHINNIRAALADAGATLADIGTDEAELTRLHRRNPH